MKYRKHEAKEYAKSVLKGVWTALPTSFTADDRIDEAGNAANLEHCISKLKPIVEAIISSIAWICWTPGSRTSSGRVNTPNIRTNNATQIVIPWNSV